MAYNHGIRVQENPTSIPTPVTSKAGVPVIFGTAPINLASDPEHATNKLFLVETFAEAKAAVGYSEDYENYTLCQAMDAFFKMYGVGPIVLCNVLSIDAHSKSFTEDATVVDGQAVAETEGIVLSSLVVKNGEESLSVGTDYVAVFDEDGKLVITLLKSGVSALKLSGNVLDPSKVKSENIIGSYNEETGVETGIELIRQVYPQFNLVPGLILAPGWSTNSSVALALAAKCKDLNGVFSCECVVDIDTTRAKKVTDVQAEKSDNGYDTCEHMICLWPAVKYNNKVMAYSAVYAAMAAYTDHANDDVPYLSPSNKKLGISATVLADGTEVNLDVTTANTLNAIGVVTAVNVNVFKSWGNNTACYPANNDPKDRWIACRRFFSWWGNSFITTYFEKVDDPANYRLIESIVDSENVRGNALASEGKCAGIRMEYNQKDNPISNILDGKIVFKQYLAPYTPAEDILNVLEFDVDMLKTALSGKEE